jgi:hypothetical protein
MYEIVDKQLNNLHKIDLNKECHIEEEKLNFSSWLLKTHQFIVEKRKII